MLFVGRTEEQDRFRQVLKEVAARSDTGPDEGYVVLVQGYGGIGKSTLLARFADVATGRLVATVDWERDRSLHAEDYALFAGPPIWRILERIRAALETSAAGAGWRAKRKVAAAFEGFRRQVASVRELEKRAAQLGIGNLLGGKPASAKDIAKILKAGTGIAELAGAPGAVTKGIDVTVDAMSSLREDRDGRVDPAAYDALVDEVKGVVRAFSDGMRSLARWRRVVLILDTCELLGGSGDWLREVMRQCGRKVVWVVGMRLEPELHADPESEAANYRRGIDERRLRAITLSRFDDRTVADYVGRRLGDVRPADLDMSRIIALTHGVPLAVNLLCDLLMDRLRRNLPIDDLFEEVTSDGQVSSVVSDMARRYLVHARREDSALHADLPLLFGLALLYSDAESEPASATRDPALLAALWDRPVEHLAAEMERLSRRHDFVHSRNDTLHRDVRDAIRLYLLAPANRVLVTDMNQRAADLLAARLEAMPHTSIDDQLGDRAWRTATAALLWHTCWINPPDGIALLCHLYPAAVLLQNAFSRVLVEIAAAFAHYCSTREQTLLAGLPPKSGFAQEAPDMLAAAPPPPRPLLVGSSEPYLHLLRSLTTGHHISERIAALSEAAAQIRPGPHASAVRLGQMAYMWSRFVALFPVDRTEGFLVAAKLAVEYLPTDPNTHIVLADTLSRLCRYDEAEDALREAIRLDVANAKAHCMLGCILTQVRHLTEAVPELREAIRLSTKGSTEGTFDLLPSAVLRLGSELVLRVSTPRVGSISLSTDTHAVLGHVLLLLGRYGEAEAELREATRLDSDDAFALAELGRLQTQRGELDEGRVSLSRASELSDGLLPIPE